MNLLYQLTRPILFAHRGASAFAPENTLSAFLLAVEHGSDAIELDCKLSADGEVVVIHDFTLQRTTGREGAVRDFKLAELRQLDAGSFFSTQFAGERIPTLDEVFEAVGKKIYINVELTNYTTAWDALPEKAAELVRRHGLQDWVIFSSFHPFNLLRVRRRLPQTPAALLALEGRLGAWARSLPGRWVSAGILHPHYCDVNQDFILKQRSMGRRVHVWTVNEPSDMQRMYALEVDGLITDDPRLARQVLESGGGYL